MNKADKNKKIKKFISDWKNKGNEKSDTQKFWIQLLQDVCEDEKAIDHLKFEVRVHKTDSTDFKDVVINAGTQNSILVEQKSIEKDLNKKYPKSGGELVTPFEQAKSYDDNSGKDDKARWIITCNFREFWIYDMNKTGKELHDPLKVKLSELDKHNEWLQILTASDKELEDPLSEQQEVSIRAGELTGDLYNALRSLYIDPDSEETLKELNKLCVRLVFCLYAEDAGLFGNTDSAFHDYLAQYPVGKMNAALKELFEILNTPVEDRDPYLDDDLKAFPYVNGGLFQDRVQIPIFNEDVANILLIKQSKEFNWSKISPTIFGAVFESTLNPETRRKGGMHYTSIENIHKVIDPLFLDELRKELNEALSIPVAKDRKNPLLKLQNKLASLKFLDPACGSGNFLTETYLCLRRIENSIIKELSRGQISIDVSSQHPVKVSIGQFYGIEINDFAVSVAQTALWIAESQMLHETEEIIYNTNLEFFPLESNNNIHEGNALTMDWNEVVPAFELNYIIGNPPFVGASMMTDKQKADAVAIYGNIHLSNSIDYVGAWYYKSAQMLDMNTNIKCALVSTNSITQGEQVAPLWESLYKKHDIDIIFAFRTFRWDSEANDKAKVHCVIIGFTKSKNSLNKRIYDENGIPKNVNIISPYLIEAQPVFISSRGNPLCNVPKMTKGNQPTDDGNFIFSKEQYIDITQKYPETKEFIKRYVGAKDYLNDNEIRYCLWLKDVPPNKYAHIQEITDRLKAIRDFRLLSTAEPTRKSADTPYKFFSTPQNDCDYLIIPRVSSERRKYIPIGFMSSDVIAADSCSIVLNADLYMFGVLISKVHMAWMRTVAGRLKSDYRYSGQMVYNNYPWVLPIDIQKKKIEETAQMILGAREKYPESSLADMYGDKMYLYTELVNAHNANDKAVMDAYGFNPDMDEPEIVARLMEMYQELTKEQ